MAEEVRCAVGAENLLGEGPCWDGVGRLWWFDIKGRMLCWHSPADRTSGVFPLPVRASVAAPRRDGTLLIAAETGLGVFDPARGTFRLVEKAPRHPPGFRSNDGNRDQAGRFWWSMMDDDGGKRAGAVYCFSPKGNRTEVKGVHIANSIAASPDNATLYMADSAKRTIYAFAMDAQGRLSRRRVFATIPDGDPDGAAVDADGCLWVAIWDGWRIERYRPDGTRDRVIETPIQRPTSLAFGGDNLATLFVTSARAWLSDEELARQPMAGSLFAVEPGVRGLALPPVFY